MLAPSPSTYRDMPTLIRPTPYQLFAFHARVFDFVFSPTLRDYMCQIQDPDLGWLTEACITVLCEWPRATLDALCRNGSTGEIDLNDICKVSHPLPELNVNLSCARHMLRQPNAGLSDRQSGP